MPGRSMDTGGEGIGPGHLTSTTAGRSSGLLAAGKAGLAPRGQVRRLHANLQSLFTWERLARTARQWERLRGPEGAGVSGVARTKPR